MSSLATYGLPYGLRDVKLTPVDFEGNVIGNSVDLPAGQTLSFAEAEEFQELRGDDSVISERGSGPSIDWSLEAGGISLAAWKVLAGGSVTEHGGTAPAFTSRTLRKKTTDARPFFRIEGQAISDSGGDIHCIIYKARATENLEGSFADGEFFVTSCGGSAYGVTVPTAPDGTAGPEENVLYDFVQNAAETAIAPLAP